MNTRSTPTTLTFADALDHLRHDGTEHVALCHKTGDGPFTTHVNTPGVVTTIAATLTDADVWFSINPVTGPPRTGPRGGADTITRLAALWADLDVKPSACPDLDAAHDLITDLSIAIGTRPTLTIASGHGLQPIWVIDDDDNAILDSPERTMVAGVILKRWGRLVSTVAATRGIAVDSVFDLPRILRVPGTTNHKGDPVPATATADTGTPLTYGEILDALDAYGIAELTSDPLLTEPVDTGAWTWAERTCSYVQKMVASWATEKPDARHPWMLAQATRLACARRKGCITDSDHTAAIDTLTRRLEALCAAGSNARNVAPSEVRDGLVWGEQRAAVMSEVQLDRELGNHSHTPELVILDGDNIAAMSTAPRPASNGTAALAPAGQPLQTERTDLGNARQLVHHHGGRLRYNPTRRAWLSWDGMRWRISDDDSPALDAAIATADGLPATSDIEQAFRRKSQARSGLENMVAIARRDRRIRVTADELDAHPYLLNTPTGTVDLETGTQHEHRPTENHTKLTAVGCDFDMPTPRWDAFLTDTFGGNIELIDYIQRVVGYAATGRVTHHILPFLHGAGANGKSVLTDVLLDVLGDYAITVPSHVLIAGRYSHDTELARLAGARLAICSEVDEDGKFDEQRVKALTGGDRLSARFLYANPFEFTPSHTLILSGNHQPSVKMGGNSFWRRLRLIPFEHTVPEKDRIDNLKSILVDEEGPGILAWIVEGAQAAMAGLNEPRSVIEATAAYEREEDSFGMFIADCLHLAPGSDIVKVEGAKLRSAYSSWCRANGVGELSAQSFGREMRRRTGCSIKASNGHRWFIGVTILDLDTDDPRNPE